ncbi:HigA family addiction module antitoxin [Desulfonema magnum]|uniref:Toxin-antitoxin system, antitoxin component n=1 Tax=Desulfonema magnum TaxID=45655 RepID=A0A975GS85_9BACT|nr:HigA family addiction module antitoxin [Desulfonema magnum]QTA90823.1 Toxin-antitoxin system, antitoxin component [Desulfonema magnum]
MLPKHRRPTHPGEILKYEYLDLLGMTESQLAEFIGISLNTVNELVSGEHPVSSDIAFRLARFFNTSTEFWLNLQRNVDLWDTFQAHSHEYEKISPLKTV